MQCTMGYGRLWWNRAYFISGARKCIAKVMAFLLGHKARILTGEEASQCKRIRAKTHGCEKGEGNCEYCYTGWSQGKEGWLALY